MVLIFVTEAYHWTLKPFALQFNKYWGDDVLVVSEKRPAFDLPDNFEWRRVPAYSEGVWPIEYYSTGIISQLKEMDDPVVTILMPDHWLTHPACVMQVNVLKGYPIDHPDVVKAGFKSGYAMVQHGELVETFAGMDIVYCPKGNQHCGLDGGTALAMGHWHRERLLALLDNNWSPWQIEVLGTQRMERERPTWYSVGTRPGLVDYQDGARRWPPAVFVDKLNDEDCFEVKALLPEWMELYE